MKTFLGIVDNHAVSKKSGELEKKSGEKKFSSNKNIITKSSLFSPAREATMVELSAAAKTHTGKTNAHNRLIVQNNSPDNLLWRLIDLLL